MSSDIHVLKGKGDALKKKEMKEHSFVVAPKFT
jgi:hypothetical protein